MTFLEKLDFLMNEQSINKSKLSKISGVPYTTIDGFYKKGYENTKLSTIRKISEALNVSIDYLTDETVDGNLPSAIRNAPSLPDEALQVAKEYWDLDYWGRKVIRSVISDEQARCKETVQVKKSLPPEDASEIIYYITPAFIASMSAGSGQPAGDDYPEDYKLIKAPPKGTTYIARVGGISMEPTYNDGDLVFVHAQEEIRPGQIGVFFMDGQQWVKELGDGVLISHNPEYSPISMRNDIRCQGLVLGICDESYLA